DAACRRNWVGAGTKECGGGETTHIAGIEIAVRRRVLEVVGDHVTDGHALLDILGERPLFELSQDVHGPNGPLAEFASALMPRTFTALRYAWRQAAMGAGVVVE